MEREIVGEIPEPVARVLTRLDERIRQLREELHAVASPFVGEAEELRVTEEGRWVVVGPSPEARNGGPPPDRVRDDQASEDAEAPTAGEEG